MGHTSAGRLAGLMAALLPPGMRRLLPLVGVAARATAARPYLVGGTVRDLLLGQANTDLDLVVEGDAAALAAALGAALGAPVTVHDAFGTATLALPWADWQAAGDPAARLPADQAGLHLDLATARTERYPYPGALPVVTLGADLAADLGRRDFAINALAVSALPGAVGHLIDPFGGEADLAAGRLAVLHPASFEDDPTRLLRGARLAGRLGMRLAVETEALARAAVAGHRLAALSGDRRRHELLLLLAEERPALGLALARALGVLEQIHPALVWDAWLAERLGRVAPWPDAAPRPLVRLLLLAYRWPRGVVEGFLALLHPDGATATALEHLATWHDRRPALARAATGAAVAATLDGLPLATLTAARLAEEEPAVTRALDWYVTDLRQRRPRLGGAALRHLGLPPGPRYRAILADLRRAVLDGAVADEAGEWAFLRARVAAPPADG